MIADPRQRRVMRTLTSYADSRGVVVRMLSELASDSETADLQMLEDLQALASAGKITMGEITVLGVEYLLIRIAPTQISAA